MSTPTLSLSPSLSALTREPYHHAFASQARAAITDLRTATAWLTEYEDLLQEVVADPTVGEAARLIAKEILATATSQGEQFRRIVSDLRHGVEGIRQIGQRCADLTAQEQARSAQVVAAREADASQ